MSTAAAPARLRLHRLAPRFAEEARERVRLSVVPRQRQHTSKVPFVALITLIMVGGVVGLLLFNTSMQQASFATSALQQQADALGAQQQTLTMQLDGLRDPQRVAEAARKIGMVPACQPSFLELGADGARARVLGTATPATDLCAMRVRPYPAQKPRDLIHPPTVVTVPAVVTPAAAAAGAPAAGTPAAGTTAGTTVTPKR